MKLFFISFLLSAFSFNSYAQVESEMPSGEMPRARASNGINKIFGKVLEANNGKPMEAASIQIYFAKENFKDSLYTGMLSASNGDFSFSDLPMADSGYHVVITALGYESWEQNFTPAEGYAPGFVKDLGNIRLSINAKQLSTVTVSATRPALIMGIDRKIYNVDKNLTAAGGTALDIMKNIPSVTVDIEGNVQLRKSTPQVFVDGRPTILTLDQIPADNIESVELITNPSAKFDASSSGGIINVVLKKNKRVGLNGLLSLSGGTPKLFSSNLNLNIRQGKLNFFGSGGFNASVGQAKSATVRTNKANGAVTDYFNQVSNTDRSRRFISARVGADYFMDIRNTITFSQNFVNGRFGNDESQTQEYLDANRQLQYSGFRYSPGNFTFDRKSSRINYKHNFPKDKQELTADINYNYGTRSSNASIINSYSNPDGTEYKPAARVRNAGNSKENEITMQVDFTSPLNKLSKIEVGLRSYFDKNINYYDAFAQQNSTENKLPLGNNYQVKENVQAAYITFSHKNENETFSYQGGLRTELSNYEGSLLDSAAKFGYKYPGANGSIWKALFPSFFISHKLNERQELQFNYTRRIRRPRFWQLNPFVDINDPVNLRQGNPQLKPEFVNSFEFNYSHNIKNGNFLGVLYFRNNPDDITQYSDTITAALYQQLNNAAIAPNAILNTFVNAGVTNRYGAEFTLQQSFGKQFDITPSIDLQYRTVKARVNNLTLDNQGFNWDANLTMNYRTNAKPKTLLHNTSIQLNGEYESGTVIPQGREIAQYSADLALRKDFLKDKKGTFTFAVNDIFNTNKRGTIYDTERYYQDSY
ncbi:MAG: outer membrane beta-barrel family protein, partial [Ferruginibacter sp.]